MSRLRAAANGLGAYVAVATALLVLAVLSLLLLLQSPSDQLLWTGTKVTGSEHGGLVYYAWHGQSYTLDVNGYGNQAHITVYLNSSDPNQAIINSVSRRALDALFIAGPLVLGAAVVGTGFVRQRSARRSNARGGFGTGLDPVVVDRLLEQIRQPPP